jgi:predicted dehydrogenase
MKRRTFLMTAGAAARALAADMPRIGVIGSGGRGRLLTSEFKEIGAQMTAVCDVYEPNLQAGLKQASTGAKPYSDYRRMLDDKSIDAVIITTPDHWHATMAIDAAQAGKDMYVEKPMCHLPDEGFRMVEAVRRHKRICQVGTQRRSGSLFLEIKHKYARPDVLGDVRLVNSWWINYQDRLSQAQLRGPLDWKQWLGPAPQRPLDQSRFFNWYYYHDYSGGLLVGQAAHAIDCIQWYMNSPMPAAVTCAGGQMNLGGGEIPETASMTVEYPENYIAVFTLGYKGMRYHTHNDQMNHYHGTKARLDVGRESYALWPQSAEVKIAPSVQDAKVGSFVVATREHIRNFLDCIVTRKDPTATVEAGLGTSISLAMAMESLRTGRRIKWDTAAKKMV